MNSKYSVETRLICNIDDMLPLYSDWSKLETGSDMTCFQTFFWNSLLVKQWKHSIYDKKFSKIYCYIVKENEQVKIIAPLLVQSVSVNFMDIGRKKGIYFLGTNGATDYLNFIYDEFDKEAFNRLFQALHIDFTGYKIRLELIRDKTKINEYLSCNNYHLSGHFTSASVHVLDSQEEYIKILSKNTRQNIRTAINRANKDNINYELSILTGEQSLQLVQNLNEIHSKRVADIRKKELPENFIKRLYKSMQNKVVAMKENKFNIILESMLSNENSVFVIVKLDKSIVGYLYGIKDKNVIRILQNCYDKSVGRYSPMFRGCYDFILGECTSHNFGIEEIDFTRGDESYKYKLGCEETNLNYYLI